MTGDLGRAGTVGELRRILNDLPDYWTLEDVYLVRVRQDAATPTPVVSIRP